MTMLLRVILPCNPFNSIVKKVTMGKNLEKIMKDIKPGATYYTRIDGERTVLKVVNINIPGDYAKYAEPFFSQFDAAYNRDVMLTHDGLKKSRN
ncbi:MAG: hypothetical protein P8X73_14275 [Ignavibacteriaceae bacterium]